MNEDIEVLFQYKQVDAYINKKVPLVFVTGGAGTGKSTFIRWVSHKYDGQVLKVAPTGIAALNIGGKTIHSMFRLAPRYITEEDIQIIPQKFLGVYRAAKIIIIDEISMVNSNTLDAIDMFLRKNMRNNEPFGGKIVLLVGDLLQLPPIVSNNISEHYYNFYNTSYFFGAKVMNGLKFEFVELKETKRQNDEKFIEILSNIRLGENISETIEYINNKCDIINDVNEHKKGTLYISPRNIEVNRRNDYEYRKLGNVKEKLYTCIVEGNYRVDTDPPSPQFLDLKIGSQVQFTKNIPEEGIVNGTIAIVENLHEESVTVKLNSGVNVVVGYNEWESFDYRYDSYKNKIVALVTGKYRQIPLKLAWASTIHKCISKDTEVTTLKGKVKISDIEIGEKVYSGFNECTVTNKWFSGIKKAFKLKLKGGMELVCSEDHKIFSYKDYEKPTFIELKNLIVGEYKVGISIDKKISYTDILSIEEVEPIEMYDIEVSEDHSFIANDIIVHNCQGVTLDSVHIDLGAGCFETGQLYVALSRSRTLEGITLSRPINIDDVKVDEEVKIFYNNCRNGDQDMLGVKSKMMQLYK